MTDGIAHAIRRALIACSVLAATIGAHVASTGGLRPTLLAPFLWIAVTGFLASGLSFGLRSCAFRAWGALRILTLLLAFQAVLHVTLHAAPSAFGLDEHVHTSVLATTALAVHVGAALLATWLILRGQRLLLGALALVRALFAPSCTRSVPSPPRRLGMAVECRRSTTCREPGWSRGPPHGSVLRPA